MRAAWIVIAVLLVSGVARAQTDDELYEQAQGYFQSGKRAYDEKKYDVAIEAFENAYRLTPKPSAAFALGMAYRNQWSEDHDASKLKRAVVLFREVLAQPEDDRKPKWDKAKAMLAVLEPVLEDLEAKQAAEGAGPIADVKVVAKTALILSSKVKGTMLRFDDGAAVAAPIVQETTPGTHRVAAYADGYYTTSQEVTALEGQALPIDLILEERPAVLVVHSERGARVAVDGFEIGGANEELAVAAGAHRVEVLRPGRHVWSQQLFLDKGEHVELDAPLRRTPKRRAVRWIGAISLGLAVAGGLTAAVARSRQQEVEDVEDAIDAGEPLTPDDLQRHNDAIDERDAWRSAAGWLLAGTAAGVLATFYLYFTDSPRAGGLVVAPLTDGAEASYAWTF